MCTLRIDVEIHLFPHSAHTNGFSSVWLLRCLGSDSISLVLCPHPSQPLLCFFKCPWVWCTRAEGSTGAFLWRNLYLFNVTHSGGMSFSLFLVLDLNLSCSGVVCLHGFSAEQCLLQTSHWNGASGRAWSVDLAWISSFSVLLLDFLCLWNSFLWLVCIWEALEGCTMWNKLSLVFCYVLFWCVSLGS